jgi:hypothetical protein
VALLLLEIVSASAEQPQQPSHAFSMENSVKLISPISLLTSLDLSSLQSVPALKRIEPFLKLFQAGRFQPEC